MGRDELRQPLHKRSFGERLWALRPSLFKTTVAVSLVAFIGGGVWLVRQPNPFAGEPIVSFAIPPAAPLQTASTTTVANNDDVAGEEIEELVPDANDPRIKHVKRTRKQNNIPSLEEQIAAINAEQGVQVTSAPFDPLPPAPFKDLVEVTDEGGLPRIGSGNRKPSRAYAKSVPMDVEVSRQPKIAILLGGMGLNQKLTEKASADLPGEITFAFAPYGNNLQDQVNKARGDGHEIMLQLPMEPMGYPANNPGPKTLTVEAGANENIADLRWHLSRFAGYTGITNYMGAKLLKSGSALRPVMKELAKRGLVFLEDSNASESAVAVIAHDMNVPLQRSSITIDSEATPAAIDAALARLEAEAKANGMAIGVGTGLEVTNESVKAWAAKLQGKGIRLVPVSQAYTGQQG